MSMFDDSMVEFLNGRHYATLATHSEDGSIHVTPVWYYFEDGCFYVSSGAKSLKVRNIKERPLVSILVDSRARQGDEQWISGSGHAEVSPVTESSDMHMKILKRYITEEALQDPQVGGVFQASGEVIIKIKPDKLQSWKLEDLDQLYFGGKLQRTPEKWFFPVD